MKLELFIARRYLFAKRNIRFINIISIISIIGITFGVAALLIVLSVFNGFNGIVTEVLVSFDPHLRIEGKGAIPMKEGREIENLILQNPAVTGTSPFISGKALFICRNRKKVAFLRGIDAAKIGSVSGLPARIITGSMNFGDSSSMQGILVGLALADQLGCFPGDEIQVITPNDLKNVMSDFQIQPTRLKVAGLYESDNKDYDANYAYISLAASQQLFNMKGSVSGIDIRVKDFTEAQNIKEQLIPLLSKNMTISTWNDLHQSLYKVMRLERLAGYAIISLIIVVASFNLLGSLAMAVIEKKRDIGILQSLGMPAREVRKVFLLEGLFVGCFGTGLGFLLGLMVLILQKQYHLFPLDTNVYIIPAIPVDIQLTDFFMVAAMSLGLSYIASYLPARSIFKMHPIDCIRWE